MSNRRCSVEGCKYLTSFERCDTHAIIGDVNFKKCIVCISSKAQFGDSVPLRCVEHKLKSDYDLGICFHIGCYRVPKFSIGVGLTPTFCFKHHPEGYSHVELCIYETCRSKCSYGSVEDGIRRYCQKHKRPGDNDLKSRNIGSRLCGVDGCIKQGNFGVIRRQRCAIHKRSGDILISSRICNHPLCSKSSTFGENGKRTHCHEHKTSYETNVIKKRRRNEYEFDFEDIKLIDNHQLDDLILGLDFNF